MVAIRVEEVTKNYGDLRVLDAISFVIPDGEFAVLLGPSGCGKTTLLRCIAGLESPNSGRTYIGEELVNDVPPGDRDLAMVFQNLALFPHMTVGENIAFPLKVRGTAAQTMSDKVREVSRLLGIEDLLQKVPRDLSGGEQQRVEIGRAIAREPKAFLMDEPLSSLDAPLRAQLRSELKRIQRELGVTTLYVTHDQAEALALADKIGVINRGALLQYDSPRTVFENPSSAFVARFVGDPQANIFDVRLTEKPAPSPAREKAKAYAVEGDGFQLAIPDATARLLLDKSGGSSTEAIQVSIRPEEVGADTSRGAADDAIPGRVALDEPLTLYRVLTVDLTGRDGELPASPTKTTMRVVVPREMKIALGQKIWLRLNVQKMHFFEKATGQVIL